MLAESNFLPHALPLLIQGAFVTLQIAFVSICIGLLGGVLLGTMNSKKLRHPFPGFLIDCFVSSARGTPLFVQLLVVYYGLPEVIGISFSPFFAGVITLGINSTAYISEIIRGSLDAIPEGQWDAAYTLGLSQRHTLQGIIFPQMFRFALPSLTNELSTLIKETSILMVIGVAELTKVSKDIVVRELDPLTIYITAAAIYLVMTSCFSFLANSIQKKVYQ